MCNHMKRSIWKCYEIRCDIDLAREMHTIYNECGPILCMNVNVCVCVRGSIEFIGIWFDLLRFVLPCFTFLYEFSYLYVISRCDTLCTFIRFISFFLFTFLHLYLSLDCYSLIIIWRCWVLLLIKIYSTNCVALQFILIQMQRTAMQCNECLCTIITRCYK